MRALSRGIFFSMFLLLTLFTCATSSFAVTSPKVMSNIEGTLEIRAANFLNPKSQKSQNEILQYILRVSDKLVYSIIFTGKEPTNLKTGQHIKISKAILEETNDGMNRLLVAPKDISITKNLSVNEMPNAFGEQKTITLLVNFQDQPNNKPWTTTRINDIIYNTGNGMVNEFSYKQATLTGKVVGWYTVALSTNTTCANITNLLPTMAKSAATAAGVDLSQYTRFVYMFPNIRDCQWAGLGTVGGLPSSSWINGYDHAGVIVHELGHNFGVLHSHSLECANTTNEGSCVSVEYGDLADTMGYPYTFDGSHFNAFQKELLGWLNFKASPPIQTVTANGSYTIDAFETANGKVKALKILRRTSPATEYYYLEFRQGIGFDTKLATCPNCDITKGIIVHQGRQGDLNSSYSLDMSPRDNNKNMLVALLPGNSFTDSKAPNGGVTFNVESVSAAGAKVNVTFGQIPPTDCRRGTPRIELSPGYLILKRGNGVTGRYDVRIVNTDSAACPVSTFTVSVDKIHDLIPVTWTPASAMIAPGSSQNVVVTALTYPSTPIGYYDVRINAANISNPTASTFTYGALEVRN